VIGSSPTSSVNRINKPQADPVWLQTGRAGARSSLCMGFLPQVADILDEPALRQRNRVNPRFNQLVPQAHDLPISQVSFPQRGV